MSSSTGNFTKGQGKVRREKNEYENERALSALHRLHKSKEEGWKKKCLSTKDGLSFYLDSTVGACVVGETDRSKGIRISEGTKHQP